MSYFLIVCQVPLKQGGLKVAHTSSWIQTSEERALELLPTWVEEVRAQLATASFLDQLDLEGMEGYVRQVYLDPAR